MPGGDIQPLWEQLVNTAGHKQQCTKLMLALNAEIGVGFLVRLKQNRGSSTGYKQQRTKLELGLLVESAGLLPVKRGWNNTSRYRKRLATTAMFLGKNGELRTECRKVQIRRYLIELSGKR